jgi:hypothetical protein
LHIITLRLKGCDLKVKGIGDGKKKSDLIELNNDFKEKSLKKC